LAGDAGQGNVKITPCRHPRPAVTITVTRWEACRSKRGLGVPTLISGDMLPKFSDT